MFAALSSSLAITETTIYSQNRIFAIFSYWSLSTQEPITCVLWQKSRALICKGFNLLHGHRLSLESNLSVC